MVTFLIETVLYMLMAATIRQLSGIKGLWPAIAFLAVFTVITQLPGEWFVLPLLFGLLLFPCLAQWGLPLVAAVPSALVPTIILMWLMHHYDQPVSLGGALPAGLTSALPPGLLGK